MRSFLKFGGLSGVGWLLDFSLLMALVRLGLPAGEANVLSSATAASCVFLVSRKLVFRGDPDRLLRRVLVYLVYTLCVICLASAAMQWLVALFADLQARLGTDLGRGWVSALAKIAVTPPQLALNFAVARFVAQRSLARHHV